jgi:exodeoxyribonuclease VII large subunit
VQPEARTVRQVARTLRETLEFNPALRDLWVEGEISNLVTASSGHIYFTLKDEAAALRCAFFRNSNMAHRHKLEPGGLIMAHGAISFYEPRGDVQLIVDFVEPAGTGALHAEFERRRAQFEAEGLFDPARKRPLPRFPRRIGVVTSEHGAAIHDVLTVLGRRWPLAEIVVAPTLVQGEGAADSIARALRAVASVGDDARPDVIIAGRGGGAAEDLWAFNEEPVVRAIFGCPVPVISAVGHETDVTLADLVADVRAPTPSAAAEIAAPDRADISRTVEMLAGNAEYALTRRIDQLDENVRGVLQHMARHVPNTALLHRRIAQHAELMRLATLRATSAAHERTAVLASRVEAMSPHATLARGYTIVSRADGTPATSAADVSPGDAIDVRWRDGSHRARVESPS